MLTINVISFDQYSSEMGLSFDFVIMKPNDILLDGFQNPCIFDHDEVIMRNENDLVELNSNIKIPIDLVEMLSKNAPDLNQYYMLFKFMKIND